MGAAPWRLQSERRSGAIGLAMVGLEIRPQWHCGARISSTLIPGFSQFMFTLAQIRAV
jgi:hypothetical protein